MIFFEVKKMDYREIQKLLDREFKKIYADLHAINKSLENKFASFREHDFLLYQLLTKYGYRDHSELR